MARSTETGFKDEPPTPRKDVGAILQKTRQSIEQIVIANRSQTQMPLRLVGWSAVLIATILILQGLAAEAGLFGIGYHLRVPEVSIFSGSVILLCGLAMLPVRNQNSIIIKAAMLVICMAASVISIIINGALAGLFLSPMIALVHIMLTPYRALWFTIGTLLLIVLIGVYFPGHEDQYLLNRFFVGALVTLVIMQILMRFISRTNRSIVTVTETLNRLVLQLDGDLLQSHQARETATFTDTATGLLNLFGFEAAVGKTFIGQPYGRRFYLLNINFQCLQEFNAIFSTNERTFILQCLITRLRDIAGADALVGRIGRDEFAVLLPHVDVDDGLMMQSIGNMQEILRRPLTSTSNTVLPSPAIGVAVWPDDSEEVSELQRCCQIALQSTYDNKLDLPVRYSQQMQDECIDRKSLSSDIAAAISMGEFEMYFQPILDLQTGRLRKAEALIRWNHPTRGFLVPTRFISLAESSGKIIAITDWVLDSVLTQLRQWREKLSPDFQISINMPTAYLEYCAENEEKMLARFEAMQIPSCALIIEITEGSLLSMTPKMLRIIAILESIGFQLAMDDFGVGYSNLSQLEYLPLIFIKIDKSLVDGIEDSTQKLAICRTIVHIGHELGIRVVAEGIESIGQEKLLRDVGCDFGQGYLFAKPMSAADFTSHILEHTSQEISS